MGWKSCAIPTSDSMQPLIDAFEAVFVTAGSPPDVFLCARTDRPKREQVFLISPAAAELPGVVALARWRDEPEPFAHRWRPLVRRGDGPTRLGLALHQ
ncbi:MAG TPA: hypothetical protein VFC47_02775 [Caulobacteraceae bacterium]|nr:hypothetical protein [Caulobacteraceae bacterium]